MKIKLSLATVLFMFLIVSLSYSGSIDLAETQADYSIGDNKRNPGNVGPIDLGDVNGDGYDDLIMGAPGAVSEGQDDTGIVYIRFGLNFGSGPGYFSESYFDLSTSTTQTADSTVSSVNFSDDFGRIAGVQINGEIAGGKFGSSLAVGDFNGDGIDDFAVSMADDLEPGGPGRVYVQKGYPGMEGLLSLATERMNSRGFYITGRNNGDRFGEVLFFMDIDHDGMDDLIMGSPNDSDGGVVDIFYGREFSPFFSQGVDSLPSPYTKIIPEGSDNILGRAFASGDLTGDGLDDLIMGAPGYSNYSNFAGITYIFAGDYRDFSEGRPFNIGLVDLGVTTDTLKIASETGSEQSGFSLAAGDLNRDGLTDLAIGAPGWAPGDSNNKGRCYVFFNDGEIFSDLSGGVITLESGDVIFSSTLEEQRLGYTVDFADFDEYSGDDLIIGAPYASPDFRSFAGAGYIIQGSASPFVFTNPEYGINSFERAIYIKGQEQGDFMGRNLTSGDFNGDGYKDIFFSGNTGNNSENKCIWGIFGAETYRRLSVGKKQWEGYY